MVLPTYGQYRHVRVNPALPAWFTAHVGVKVKAVTEAVADDCRIGCPIDSGALVSSIRTRYPGGLRGVVVVGGFYDGEDLSYWETVEYGSPAHLIVSHGPWSLHNAETGEYFGRVVHHPGTPEQPFMRPALYHRRGRGLL